VVDPAHQDVCGTLAGDLPVERWDWLQASISLEGTDPEFRYPPGTAAAAVETVCPEYLPDLQRATEFLASEGGSEAPTIESMYPQAIEHCTEMMLDQGSYTLEETARESCEVAMDPADEDTHWMIDMYFTTDPADL
jgi:hypothetical protein